LNSPDLAMSLQREDVKRKMEEPMLAVIRCIVYSV